MQFDYSDEVWNCDFCKKYMFAFMYAMTSDRISNYLTNDLSGPYFCESPELGLDQSQIEVCQSYVTDIMGKALKILFPMPNESGAAGVCNYYFGLCDL